MLLVEARPLYLWQDSQLRRRYWTQWNNLGGDYGSVAIQLIVETNGAAQHAVTPQDFGTYRVGLGQTKTVDVTFNNFGESLKNLDYTVTMDDKTSDEYHIDLTETDNALTGTGTVTVPVVLPAASAMGTYPVTLTVTKVNGEENQAARKEANGTCMTVFKDFVQKVFVEEMTGTGCGWCPRGIVGMQLMKQKYGDRFVGVAIHRYNASTDPMAPASISRSTTFPQAMHPCASSTVMATRPSILISDQVARSLVSPAISRRSCTMVLPRSA